MELSNKSDETAEVSEPSPDFVKIRQLLGRKPRVIPQAGEKELIVTLVKTLASDERPLSISVVESPDFHFHLFEDGRIRVFVDPDNLGEEFARQLLVKVS
ncbi:MAG: hypothetical protein WCV72_05105 [Patescibacteria group bacterium]